MDDGDGFGYVSFVSTNTVIADGVYHFLRGCLYGGIWGLVTPFYAPGTAGAAAEVATGVFKPAPPFSSLQSIPSNAAIFGTVFCVQRVTAKSLELLRRKSDWWNEIVGLGVTCGYYTEFLGKSEKRLMMHNRAVGATVAISVLYANFMA